MRTTPSVTFGTTLSCPKGKCEVTPSVTLGQHRVAPKGFCEITPSVALGQLGLSQRTMQCLSQNNLMGCPQVSIPKPHDLVL
jgi:hypothetical protein